MLADKNPSELATQLRTAFEREAVRILKETGDDSTPVPTQLPYSAVFHVLRKSNYLQLNQVQLLTLMSWSDCYPGEDGNGIDYGAFAVYAADVIVRMSDAKELEHRAQVVSLVRELGEEKVIGSLTAEELETFLKNRLSAAQESHGSVDEKTFIDVICGIPHISLSEREASSVSAVAPRFPDRTVNWQEFLPWAFTTIYDVCRERLIGRRIALMKVSCDPSDKQQLENLIQKLISNIRLQHVTSKILISFPSDDAGRRSSIQINLVQNRSVLDGMPSDGSHRMVNENDLIRMCRLIPCISNNGKDKKKSLIPMMLRVVEVDTMINPDRAPLSVYATSVDMTIKASLSLRLPSIGLVDREAAEQFAANLIDKLHVVVSTKSPPELRVVSDDY